MKVAADRNEIPLDQLVLGPQLLQERIKDQVQDYHEMIQEKCKLVNMNAMPQKGMDSHNSIFRLDQPNI